MFHMKRLDYLEYAIATIDPAVLSEVAAPAP
jgi:hypothetical protein